MLGAQPKIGPLPANQVLPWMTIGISIWFFASMFSLPTIWTVLLIFWGDITWWILTGKQPWRFLSKFIGVPSFTRGRVRYQSIHVYLNGQQTAKVSAKIQSKSKPKSRSSKSKP